MESERQPPSSSLPNQHDFPSLVSWPQHWQPESFEVTTTTSTISNITTPDLNNQMTQVVPEPLARAKLTGTSGKENSSTNKNRTQRSNSATLSTISVTCDTDTSIRARNSRPQPSPGKKSSTTTIPITTTSSNNMARKTNPSNFASGTSIPASHSSSALTNVSVFPSTSFHNNHHHQRKSGASSLSSMSTSQTTSSGMNIIREKQTVTASASTTSIPNKHSGKKTGEGATAASASATGPLPKNFPLKYKATSFDEQHRSAPTRGVGKSVLEHLVFVFPDNVRRMLAGPRNLTVRTDEGRQPAESIDIGEPPSIEEIKSWAESFDKLMLSPGGRHHFRDFLRSEYSEENFLFWMSCESLKNEQNPDIIEEKARLIYEDYISILSPKEVSLDSRVREVINKNMVEPSPHTFDEAQLQIYTLMHRDSYPRFINSQTYRRLLRNEGAKT